MSIYNKIGIPGTVGSMDCTHLKWTNCPPHLINGCKGKEKYATLAFQVVCSHTRLIFYCSKFYPGAMNDQSICQTMEMNQILMMMTSGLMLLL